MEQLKTVHLRGTDSAKVIQVIVTSTLDGTGKSDDPYIQLLQYWDLDGRLLARANGADSPIIL